MPDLEKLVDHLRKLPGIGPRQARRFAHFIVTQPNSYATELARLVRDVRTETENCNLCQRFFFNNSKKFEMCEICRDNMREKTLLMIVPRDIDLENVEKSGAYRGRYFVLGGTLPILEKEPDKKIRTLKLISALNSFIADGLKEIIISMHMTPEGEHTEEYIRHFILPIAKKHNIKISVLGRGLSTGAELEYVDSDTLKAALKHRD